MTDKDSGDGTNTPNKCAYQEWILRCIAKVKGKFHERRTKKKNEGAQDRAARRTANATLAIAIFTLVAVVVGALQWKALKHTDEKIAEQVEALRDQLTLAYPPKFRGGSIVIWEHKPDQPVSRNEPEALYPGIVIHGEVHAINNGNGAAFMEWSDCVCRWVNGPLPMEHPLFERFLSKKQTPFTDPSDRDREVRIGDKVTPGTVLTCSYTCEPMRADSGDLYVIGALRYWDRLKNAHSTFFARKYTPAEHRFYAVEHPDYEGQD